MKNINTTELINFFHKAPIANAFSKADFVSVNKKSVLFGYAIHPDCCTIDVLMWLDTMIDVDNERQKIVGLIHNNTFYFMNLHSGNGNVSCFDDTGKSFIDTMCNRTKCFLDMKDILIRAGFVEVEDGETPDIDFTHPEKDTIINLLSTED